MRFGIAVVAALCAPAAAPAAEPPPLTVEQARSLPRDALVDIVMRQLGANVREVTRPNYDSPLAPGLPLTYLGLATAPQSAGYAGLCEATAIHVSFYDESQPYARGRDVPRRAGEIRTEQRYKVIGDVEISNGIARERRRQQDEQCARLAQVIPPDDVTMAQRAFFTFNGELNAATAAHVLQRLLRDVRGGRHTDLGCGQSAERCTDPAAWLRALSLDDLLSVEVERLAESDHYRFTGEFLVGGTGNVRTTDVIVVEATYGGYPHTLTDVGRATIGRRTLIRD